MKKMNPRCSILKIMNLGFIISTKWLKWLRVLKVRGVVEAADAERHETDNVRGSQA